MNNNIKKPILLILLKPNYLNIHKVIISSSSKSNYKKAYKTKNDINCKVYKITENENIIGNHKINKNEKGLGASNNPLHPLKNL